MIRRQKLREEDPVQRVRFCNWFLERLNDENNFLEHLIVSDEAFFSLNAEVNTRNVIQYAPYGNGHPEDHYVEFEQGADQIMVWMGITGEDHVLGPHFVQRNLNTREYL